MSTSSQSLIFNGVNGATGDYLLPAMTTADVARLARGEQLDEQHRKDLEVRNFLQTQRSLRVIASVDLTKLDEAGWGVVFSRDADPAIRESLVELLEHRRSTAALSNEKRYREYVGEEGYRAGESAYDFLLRFGAGPGPANPDKVPYYILIVGDPDSIPFSFQYQLDVERAVGRIHFDTLEEYAQYARSVVTAETSVTRPRRAVFFGVSNHDDPATQSSSAHLVAPLAASRSAESADWTVESVVGDGQATKARLQRYIGGDETPALLFTASHGIGFPVDDSRLLPHQGGLLCQDWPGPKEHRGDIPQDFYFAGDDVGDDANLLGMIGFHFACYGAGTPRLDDFAHHAFAQVAPIAPRAFVAGLPRRMLGHPRGGALAFVGHVERAWGYSFDWPGAGPQIDVFESALQQLMEGMPLGAALEFFNGRYAELSTILTGELNAIKQENLIPDDVKLAGLWIANNDARGYAIIGDPAVRLKVGDPEVGKDATTIDPVTIVVGASTTPASPTATAPPTSDATGQPMSYGWLWGDDSKVRELPERLFSAIEDMTERLSQMLQDMLQDVTSVHVETYVSDDVENVQFDPDTRRFTGSARARAMTHISADGDTYVCVPEEAGEVDDAVWAVHAESVRQAQQYRAEMLRTAISTVTSFFGPVRPG